MEPVPVVSTVSTTFLIFLTFLTVPDLAEGPSAGA
jgi:hypothetical protein